ncbi:MAG: type II toxin-antitoxin system prevent-host-death family antitoxin [Bacteroidota bacterium]
MESTAKKLRFHTKELLETVARGEEVIITLRGKPYAKLIPYKSGAKKEKKKDELFGLWKDHEELKDVSEYVRNLRKRRH